MSGPGLGWLSIVRLGLVQTALGAIVVLTTSTINRVMVVELALPAMLPGFLVALHHVVQMSRPHFGHRSDVGGRRTPWIIGGMFALALGGVGAATGTAVMATAHALGVAIAVCSFVVIGLGVGAAGTSLLALLAKRVEPGRRAAAATIVWIMMIAGFAITAGAAGHFLDPFSPERLVAVTSTVSAAAFLVTVLALWGVEGAAQTPAAADPASPHGAAARPHFGQALREVWEEPDARRFTIFVFVSMLAYSTQDLILEPFAGLVFGMTPGESTQLAGVQHGGVLLGMLLVAITGTAARRAAPGLLRWWTVGGCAASALALAGIALGGGYAASWPLRLNVFLLGLANGAFAVAAIASMMTLAGGGKRRSEGIRMGLWGGAQAIAFGLGGFLGTVAIDVARLFLDNPAHAYAIVFSGEAALFLYAAVLGMTVRLATSADTDDRPAPSFGDVAMAEVLQGR
ncbi:BCD family MFS transporter [Pseudohaliea rubra]|uniref:Bacteriochlorophyll synthase 44.5 kDa chain n=1 Tax=Pseudohaliea rubra DSM 19751 TaxID=1265313 RepID=A0A095VV49_9GAMM|nr:BCD family MFS transporter [Pseudohaliea rubra]KGE05225.1 Bacteriochlorophyll synthase 44.5 kDa chain [Pseudohaliea rubra DSM 19751]